MVRKKIDWKYPHIPHLLNVKPSPRILLGQRLFWTEKKDGSCITMRLEEHKRKKDNILIDGKKYVLIISSRNQIHASSDLIALVKRTEEFPKILELFRENPQFIIYAEACRKGPSITGIEAYERDYLFVFDIYDIGAEKFLPYVNVHQHCFHHKISVVKLYAETRHRSMKDLLKFADEALNYCKETKIEGMVIKAYKIPTKVSEYFKEYRKGLLQTKVKLDIPKAKKRKIAKGEPIYPPIPDNEIFGSIDKAWQELGTEKFRDVKLAMPLIAQLVSEECKKHLYSSPKKKLFNFYNEYLERMIKW